MSRLAGEGTPLAAGPTVPSTAGPVSRSCRATTCHLGLLDAASGPFGRRQTQDLPVPVRGVSVHARVSDRAGSGRASRGVTFRQPPRRRHPGVTVAYATGHGFRGSIPGLLLPLQRFTSVLVGSGA